MGESKRVVEMCNHCGRSVAWGSGSYANRVPDCNDVATRIANNLKYPYGDYVCADCDSLTSDEDDLYWPCASLN